MLYIVTSDQGQTVVKIAGQRKAEEYIRSIARKGSYSVETGEDR